MFKSKIEKRTKEEFKLEIDKWLDFITSKGVFQEIYKPPNMNSTKSSKMEEESLKHGIQKLEFKEEKVEIVKSKLIRVKEFLRGFYFKNPKEIFAWLICLIIISLLIVVTIKLNNMLIILNDYSREIKDIKSLLTGEKNHINTLSQVNLNKIHGRIDL
jgi:hypothetical protein